MKQKMKKVMALLLAMMMLLGLAACGSKEAPAEAPAETEKEAEAETPTEVDPVKIGVIMPLTGSSARMGELELGGIQYAVDHINNELGGIQALGGAKIELVIGDSTGVAEVGVSEAERMINNENVDGLIGTYNSGVASAVIPIAEKYGVPFVLVNATSNNLLLNQELKYTVRTNQSDLANGQCYVDVINALNELGTADKLENFAIIHENTDWGSGVVTSYGDLLKEAGYNLVLVEAFETGKADFSSIVNKIKSADVDAILPAMYVSDANLFVQQLAEYDVNVPLIGAGGGMLVDDFISTMGEYAEGILTINGWSSDVLASKPELAREIDAKCQEDFGCISNEQIANGWLGAMVMYEAFETAATTDKDAVAEALLATNIDDSDLALLFHPYQGCDFEVVDGMTNQNKYAKAVITQVIDGQMRMVFDGTKLVEDVLVYPQPTFDERGL